MFGVGFDVLKLMNAFELDGWGQAPYSIKEPFCQNYLWRKWDSTQDGTTSN